MPQTLDGKTLLYPISLQNTTDYTTSLQFYLPKPNPKVPLQKTRDGKNLLYPISLQNTTMTTPPHCSSTCQCNPTRDQVLPLFLAVFWCAPKGFRKVDPDRWEFASEGFLRGQKHLLKTLKRRRAPSHLPSEQSSAQLLEVRQFGFDRDIDQLRRDKSILMAEMVKLRQEQQNTREHLMAMEARLQGTEQKQQMMAFLARALHNPNPLHQLALRNDRNKALEQAILKKRRSPICRASIGCNGETSNGLEWSAPVKKEYNEYEYNEYGYELSEMESLALEIQGFERSSDSGEELEEKDEGELTSDDDLKYVG